MHITLVSLKQHRFSTAAFLPMGEDATSVTYHYKDIYTLLTFIHNFYRSDVLYHIFFQLLLLLYCYLKVQNERRSEIILYMSVFSKCFIIMFAYSKKTLDQLSFFLLFLLFIAELSFYYLYSYLNEFPAKRIRKYCRKIIINDRSGKIQASLLRQ